MAYLLLSVSQICLLETGLDWTLECTSFAINRVSSLQIFKSSLEIWPQEIVCSRLIWINCKQCTQIFSIMQLYFCCDLKGLINLSLSRQTAWFNKITQKPQHVSFLKTWIFKGLPTNSNLFSVEEIECQQQNCSLHCNWPAHCPSGVGLAFWF